MIFEWLYQKDIKEARELFQDNFTCKVDTAPHWEEIEVAVIPWKDLDEKWDNVQVCLFRAPACFMEVYLRQGEKKIFRIGTRSGSVKDLWGMVKPIIDLEAKGAVGFYPFTNPLASFSYKQLQDELDRRDNEREIENQARHDVEMAEED